MQLPENAIARLREAAEHAPDAKRLLLTMRMDEEWLGEAFEAGADGVLSKSVHPVSMGTLLREIAQGNVVQRFRATPPGRQPGGLPAHRAREGDPRPRRRGLHQPARSPASCG